ncbi:hypothetical protein [Microbacterium sp. NPDC087665]|uniref:DUF7507 domain-containing protein n=1 Tax=Microbacterium sp. NPDC087665 TaxID=3364194 RepID=UPI00380E3B93
MSKHMGRAPSRDSADRQTRARIAGKTPRTAAGRFVRAAALGIAGILAGSSLILGAAAPANAADGDYTLELDAPASIPVGQNFNYTATLDFEGPAATHSGIVLTTTLPAGVEFESCPIGGSSPIASCSYDSATRVLTISLNDTDTDPLSVAYTVRQAPYNDRYEGEVFAASIAGTGGPSGAVTSDTVETVVTGSNDYNSYKTSQVITGGDNRTVTYSFNINVAGPIPGTFASHMQELTDTFPGGVELVSSNAGIGAWDVSAFPTVVWSNDAEFFSYASVDPSGSAISITVRYPEDAFPGLVSPPANTVSLRTQDAGGVWHDGAPATTQSIPFAEGDAARVAADKSFTQGGSSAGYLGHQVRAKGSYVGPSGSPNLDALVVEDSGATGTPNASWYQHIDLSTIQVSFNSALAAANLPYTFDYQVNGSTTWQSVTPPGSTGTTAEFATHVAGSQAWNTGTTAVDLAPGETISGWRVVVAPGAETVPVNSEVQVTFGGQPVFRAIGEGIVESPAAAGAPVGPTENTVSVRNGDGTLVTDDTYNFTPVDSVYLTTTISGPSSMSVGGTGSYRASIINQNPSDVYADSVMTVVLPCGILYDDSQPFVPEATPLVGVPSPAPAIGSGVTVDTTKRITDANGCAMQVVEFTFDEVPPMRAPGVANHRRVEDSGWTYTIPVIVLAEAYNPAGTTVVPQSWSHTNDPRFLSVADGGTGATTVPMIGYNPFFNADGYDLDPTRDTIGYWQTRTSINTAGGVLIDKLSSATADGAYALTSPITDDAFWRIFVSNVLPGTVSNAVFFDKLPAAADGDDFGVTLTGPVTGIPAGATVEYSTDATSATTGTWTATPTGATAFRVTVPSMATATNFTLTVPTSVDGETVAGQSADNQISATAVYGGNPVAFESNEAVVTVAAASAISIVKTTNGIDVPTSDDAPVVPAGSTVQWSYLVTNTGNTTLSDVTVADIGGAAGEAGAEVEVVAPEGFDGILAPGESVTFTGSGTAIEGLYENVATATGAPSDAEGTPLPETDPVTATDSSWYTGGAVGLTIVKQVSLNEDGPWSESVTAPSGTKIYWSIAVTNTGEAPLTNVVVSDPLAPSFEPQTIDLAIGETRVFVVEHTLTEALTNVATASVDVNGDTVAVADDAAAAITPVPPVPDKPTTGLAITGADATAILIIALLLIAGGMGIVVMRRRVGIQD